MPFLRNWSFSRKIIDWFAEKTQKTKTREEVENGFWGKLVNRVMKHPIAFAAPIIAIMIAMIIPWASYPSAASARSTCRRTTRCGLHRRNSTRSSWLPHRTDHAGHKERQRAAGDRSAGRRDSQQGHGDQRLHRPGQQPRRHVERAPYLDGASKDKSIRVIQNGLVVRNEAAKKINELRSIVPPKGETLYVGGTPALEQDSIHSLFAKLP